MTDCPHCAELLEVKKHRDALIANRDELKAQLNWIADALDSYRAGYRAGLEAAVKVLEALQDREFNDDAPENQWEGIGIEYDTMARAIAVVKALIEEKA